MRFKTFMGIVILSGLSLVSNGYGGIPAGCVKISFADLPAAQNAFQQKFREIQSTLTGLDNQTKKLSPAQATAVHKIVDPQVTLLLNQMNQVKTLVDSGIACPFPDYDQVLTAYKKALPNITQRVEVPAPSTKDPRSRFAAQSAQVFRVAIMDAKPDRFANYILQFRPRNLNLSYLGLGSLPSWLPSVNLSEVESLDLSGNKLSDLRPLRNMVNLKNLNLANNRLTKLEGLENLPKLQGLYAQNNSLSTNQYGHLMYLPGSVVILALDSNGFKGEMPLLSSPNLKRLSLNNNNISVVCTANGANSSNFPYNPQINPQTLERLELRNTNLDQDSRNCLLRLETIRAAQNNPIKILPQNLLSR